MKLKTIDVGGTTYAAVTDGKPVYVDDAGKEIAFDAPHAVATIGRLNGEAKGHREAKEAAEKALKDFDGITDPKAARKALETVSSLDAKALIDAGKAEEMRAAAIKAVEAQYAPFKERAEKLEAELRAEKIGGGFARSKMIAEKVAVPAPMMEATFGRHFSIEDGRIVAKDANGNTIYSKSKPGELADFDEALETLIEGFPFRDSILKGRNAAGTGATGGAGKGNARSIPRAEFDGIAKADPAAAAKLISDGIAVV